MMPRKINERIKELAEQAGLRFTQQMSNPMVPVVDGRETDLAKFAELIVKKCISIVDTEEFGLMTQDRNYRIQTTKKIREHFGIEL